MNGEKGSHVIGFSMNLSVCQEQLEFCFQCTLNCFFGQNSSFIHIIFTLDNYIYRIRAFLWWSTFYTDQFRGVRRYADVKNRPDHLLRGHSNANIPKSAIFWATRKWMLLCKENQFKLVWRNSKHRLKNLFVLGSNT